MRRLIMNSHYQHGKAILSIVQENVSNTHHYLTNFYFVNLKYFKLRKQFSISQR